MSTTQEIHIGERIKEVFEQRGMGITQFAKMLEFQRPNIYDIFKRKSIDIDLLRKISEILAYDFIEEVYIKSHPLQPTNPFLTNIIFQIQSKNFKEMEKVLKKLKKTGIV